MYIFDFRQNRCSASHETPESPTCRFSCTGHNSIFYGLFYFLEKNFAYGKLHVKMEIRYFNSLTPTIQHYEKDDKIHKKLKYHQCIKSD